MGRVVGGCSCGPYKVWGRVRDTSVVVVAVCSDGVCGGGVSGGGLV